MVLRRRPDHRGSADVDLLDCLGPCDARARHRLLEGIEARNHEVDGRDTVLGQGRQVLGHVPPGQDAPVDLRVERLDAPVEHLGKAGDFRDLDHGESGLAK